MQCRETKQLLPEYIQGELKRDVQTRVQSHLNACHGCREELRLMQETWRMLGEVDDIEPAPGYVSRFWAGVESQRPWHEQILQRTKYIVFQHPWVPALASAAVILIVAGITLLDQSRYPESETAFVAAFKDVDPDMVKHIDIIENLELIQNIDFYTDLEIIENLDESEAS